jgi:hypothetical protein
MPPEPRTLVLCFDGTSNEYDGEVCPPLRRGQYSKVALQNTNVVKFFSLLKKDDSEQQLVYYQVCYFFLVCKRCGRSSFQGRDRNLLQPRGCKSAFRMGCKNPGRGRSLARKSPPI